MTIKEREREKTLISSKQSVLAIYGKSHHKVSWYDSNSSFLISLISLCSDLWENTKEATVSKKESISVVQASCSADGVVLESSGRSVTSGCPQGMQSIVSFPYGFILVFELQWRNVTERQREEEKLQESECKGWSLVMSVV